MADNGCLVTFAGINNDKVYEAADLMLDVYLRVAQEITDDDLRRAKDYVIGMLTLQYEDSEYRSEANAAAALYGSDIDDLEAKISEVESITLANIRSIAAEIIDPEKACLALIGPFQDKEKFAKILGK